MERRVLVGAYALLGVASLCLIWLPRHLPFVDLGNHLAAAAVWHYYGDPAWDFARYYHLQLGANPYWAVYGLIHLFAYPLGIEAAGRLVISLYVLGVPLSMLLLGRRFGASDWMGLFGFAMAFNFNLQWGFLNYCLGLPATLFALVAFDAFCARPTLPRGVLAVAAGVGVYFFHILTWGLYLACAGLVGLLHQGLTWRRLLSRLAVWSGALAAGLWVTLRGSTLHMGHVGDLSLRFYPMRHHARELAAYLWHGCAEGRDDLFGLWLFACWAMVVVTAPRQPLRLHALRGTACAMVALLAFLALPRSVLNPVYWWGINVRYAAAIGLFVPLAVPGALLGWRRLLMAPVVLASLSLLGDHFVHYRRAVDFADGYDRLAALPPPRSRVLVLVFQPWHDPTWRYDYLRNYYGLQQALHGGYHPWDFENEFPFVYAQRFPAPDWSHPTFRWEPQARYWDYVLAFQAPRGLLGNHTPLSTARDRRWTLWQLPGPRIDVPPGPAYPYDWAYDAKWRPPGD